LLLEDEQRTHEILLEHGYQLVYKTDNVAQYRATDVEYGSVDILFAFREISKAMLKRSVPVSISQDLHLKTLIPEDIIGLKLQALTNDPSRFERDFNDMQALVAAMRRQNLTIDWDLLGDYCQLFDRADLLVKLKADQHAS
jgi:predicted nucleotidyltransferase